MKKRQKNTFFLFERERTDWQFTFPRKIKRRVQNRQWYVKRIRANDIFFSWDKVQMNNEGGTVPHHVWIAKRDIAMKVHVRTLRRLLGSHQATILRRIFGSPIVLTHPPQSEGKREKNIRVGARCIRSRWKICFCQWKTKTFLSHYIKQLVTLQNVKFALGCRLQKVQNVKAFMPLL